MVSVRKRFSSSEETHKIIEDRNKSYQTDEGTKTVDETTHRLWKGVYTCVFIVILAIVVLYLWPSKFNPKRYRFAEAPPLSGTLKPNSELANADQAFKGRLRGPETILFHEGVVYTGTADGKVLRIIDGIISVLAQFGPKQQCNTHYDEKECGRPLGMAMSPFDGYMWVIDATFGLHSINITTGEFKRRVPSNQPMIGRYSKFLNDVTISPINGKIYFSDSSTKWRRSEFYFLALETNPDGRILEYNPETNELAELCTGISPNGIQITTDATAILLSDTVYARICRCHVEGIDRGKLDTVVENLPGFPDNIRASPRGSLWVALTAVRYPTPLIERISTRPFLKEMIYKLTLIWKSELLKSVRTLMPRGSPPKSKTYGMILEISEDGEVLRSLHDPSGKIWGISHVLETQDGRLYLGSATNDYIGILDI